MYAGSERPRLGATLGWVLATTVAVVLVWSRLYAVDRLTWWLESIWVVVGLPLAIAVARTRGVTTLLLTLLAGHAVVLLVGARYTYEFVPLGEWIQAWTGSSRNNFDRFGHLLQGFVPALLARELLRRATPLRPDRWLGLLCVACALAFSALFEMIEWGASVALGASADAYLGSQGDRWDAQWDMFCALVGASLSIVLLSGWHEAQLCVLARTSRQR
jgi:putative membrane protein